MGGVGRPLVVSCWWWLCLAIGTCLQFEGAYDSGNLLRLAPSKCVYLFNELVSWLLPTNVYFVGDCFLRSCPQKNYYIKRFPNVYPIRNGV